MTAAQLIAIVRGHVVEATATYWSDLELLALANLGVKDLWRRIVNTHQDYFFQSDTGCSLIADTLDLQDVPSNVSIVIGLEPVTPSSYPSMNFFPRRFTHPDMIGARSLEAQDAGSCNRMFYSVTGPGGPIGSPTIYVAPKVTSTIPIRLTFVPLAPEMVLTAPNAQQTLSNPVPGESDNAIVAWTTAYALAKEPGAGGERIPDAGWMAIYEAQALGIIVFVTPRQDDEPEVAEGVHEIWMFE